MNQTSDFPAWSKHSLSCQSSESLPVFLPESAPCGGWEDQFSPETSVRLHCETGGPNISMVSRTSDRWSRNEFTDTLRIRASSALHFLKHTKNKFSSRHQHCDCRRKVEESWSRVFLHRQLAARHCELFADAAFPRLSVRRQRAQSDLGLTRRREGNVQRAARGSRNLSNISTACSFNWWETPLKNVCDKCFYPNCLLSKKKMFSFVVCIWALTVKSIYADIYIVRGEAKDLKHLLKCNLD